ncbi:Uncharacterised protein [Mycobacteroides abscessus subsp. abscessus]|nr:Uncharacterised protein [Mycobacteroides abscessus subsp. abscessus]
MCFTTGATATLLTDIEKSLPETVLPTVPCTSKAFCISGAVGSRRQTKTDALIKRAAMITTHSTRSSGDEIFAGDSVALMRANVMTEPPRIYRLSRNRPSPPSPRHTARSPG